MWRSFLTALLALAGLSGFAHSASAQEQIGTGEALVLMEFIEAHRQQMVPFIYRGKPEQAEGAWIAHRFARCAVNLNQNRARDLLDSSIAGRHHAVDLEKRYFRRLRTCTPLSGMVDVSLVRAALAENILLSTEPPDGFRAVRSIPELVDFLGFAEALDASAENLVTVTQLGYQCRGAVSPAAAYAVLDTEPGSAEEAEALKDLDRRTSLCDAFFDRGEEVSHWFRRAFLARGVYYWQRFLEA